MSSKSEYFGDIWCPLTGELPYEESLLHEDERIFDCIEVIEKIRKFLNTDSHGNFPEWKLRSAQMLWKLFRNLNKSIYKNGLYKSIPWSEIYSDPEINKQITESEIKAIFLIYMTYRIIDYCNKGAQEDATTLIGDIEEELNLLWKNKKVKELKGQQNAHLEAESNEQSNSVNMIQPNNNIFRWCSGTWEITYNGTTIRPPDSKGLRYIYHLILNMNKKFYSLDLMSVTSSIQSEEKKQVLLERSTQVENDELDEQLKDGIPPQQLRQSLYVLNQKLESAESLEEKEDIQKQIDKVTEKLEIIQGEGSADKARIAVYNAINRALDKIKKEHLPLYDHLKVSLKTGISFTYNPTKPIHWSLK